MAQYTTSKKMSNYAPNTNQSSYANHNSNSYQPSGNHTPTSSLQVIQGQIKEKIQGICTCEKKVACRGTCRT